MAHLFTALRDVVRNVRRLVALAWQDHKLLLITLGSLSATSSGIAFLRTGAIALLINALAPVSDVTRTSITIAVALAIVASVVPDLIYSTLNYFDRQFYILVEQKIELLFVRRKAEIDLAAYEDPKFNDLLNRAEARGTFPMAELLQAQFSNLQSLIEVAIASGVLVAVDWRLFVLVLLGSLPKFAVEARYGRGVWGVYDAEAETRRRFFDVRGHFYDLRSLTELKLFQNVRHFHNLLTRLLSEFNTQQRHVERRKLIWLIASIAVGGGCIGAAILLLTGEVQRGNMAIGTMVFVFGSIAALQNAISRFFLSAARQYQYSLFVTDLFRVIDTKPSLPRPAQPRLLDASAAPSISFQDVSFAYPGTDTLVLRNVSLAIEPGERVAIVGVNGEGKTTLAKLLCRIYDPTAGRILVDGQDLRELDLTQWHAMLGVLFQDYASYHFPVKEVIALGQRTGSADLDMEKVRKAARQSGAESFIRQWQGQYEQMLGRQFTNGVDPSKGQLQKLALARSFYRDPRVMILDEPTSSIDAEAESRLFEQFEALGTDTTVLVISHRFSNVRSANRICVLKNGTIAELGTHDALMERDGIYAHLFQLQASRYRDARKAMHPKRAA
jgi:ATP-binding cassette subfamily B protein